VILRARIGEVFPSLELVHRMRDRDQSTSPVLFVNARRNGLSAVGNPDDIHACVRMPISDSRNLGNLSRSEQDTVLRQLRWELERQFHYQIVQATSEPSPGFRYPYLRSIAGSLVFSRLLIEDYVPLSPDHEPGSRFSYFHRT